MGNAWSQFVSYPAPDVWKFAFANSASHILGYWIPNFFLYVIWKNRWFQKYKIQGDTMPPQPLIKDEIRGNLLATFVTSPIASLLLYKLYDWGKPNREISIKKPQTAEEEKAAQEEAANAKHRIGWANLRFRGTENKSLWDYFWMTAVGYFLYDFGFYWMHRTLHNKAFYKKIHSQHHKFYATVGVAASYAHPFESLLQLLIWHLPIGVAGYLKGDLSPGVFFVYSIFRWFETVDAHSGYSLPFSPFTLIPIFGGASHHDDHHSMVDGNFGASVLWDKLFGTTMK